MDNIKTKQTIELSGTALDEFSNHFSGSLIRKDDPSYHADRQLWNRMIDKKPALIARCRDVSDVIHAVNFARENHLLVAVRGGGHNVAGNAMNDDGIVIDLSQMRTVRVDPENKTANVQGGATWADVDQETQAFGLACAGGIVSETGVAGLTLGGGFSWFRRKAGMSIDNLIGAEMVLADGRSVYASEKENRDLFWAIRGGGGNFGIVTSFDFKLQEIGPEVMFAACIYPRAEAERILKFWVEYTRHIPDEVTSDCVNWSVPEHESFPPELHNQPITVLSAMYAGPTEKGREALQPLREVATPLLDLSNVYPYLGVQKMFDPFLEKNKLYSYWKCLFLEDIPESLQKRIVERVNELPAPQSLVSIRNLQGAISRVPAEATAFGDRSARFLLSIDTMWLDPEQNEANIQWTRDFWNEMRQHSHGQVYFNFNSDMNGTSDMLKDSYGRNYEKLVEIKTKYDPDNFFRLNANIKPRLEI
ncbi:MAG: FAD-binding oxidoreductase [Cyclobacteriaceae bacterium]|nr:FAD-binding oxidoreductase [Cyclobacteriaceae bacterium]